jgi:hypothetical protein
MAKPITQPRRPSAPGVASAGLAAAAESKVLRDEVTYTTLLKEYHPIFRQGVYEVIGTRTELTKAPIIIELRRGQEFHPTEFLANFKGRGWDVGEAQKLLNALRFFLEEKRKSAGGAVRQWFDRPRPISQMELETELRGTYEALEESSEVIAEKNSEIESLRARLEVLEKKPQA